MDKTKCVLTGCDFVDMASGRIVHGDLHRLGETYIFNACLTINHEAAWHQLRGSQHVVFVDGGRFFERRGVLVFNKFDASFSDAAREHMATWGA